MTRTLFIKIILPILIIALAIGGFKALKSNKSERVKPQVQEKEWLVETLNASLQSLAPDLTLYATVQSPSMQTAFAPAAAVVASVQVLSGAYVKQGDVLIALEQQDFNNTVNRAKADVLEVKARLLQLQLKHETSLKALTLERNLLTLSQSELDRVERLQKRGLGSDSILTNAKSALAKQQLAVLTKEHDVKQFEPNKQQLNAQLMRLNATLDQAELAQQRSVIKAQFNGTVASVDVAQGDRVKSAQQLITLYPSQKLEAKTRIPVQFQYEIETMLRHKQKIQATASLSGKPIVMQLDRVAGQASANGIEVYFSVTQGSDVLKVGQFLTLNVTRAAQQNVVKIPLQALYGTNRIYLLKEGRLQGLNVETVGYFKTSEAKQWVLIRHPSLSNNDIIVVTHLPNAITGLKVKTSEQ